MKLFSGKRVGQSGQELAEAVFFSFFLHVIFLLAAVFLYLQVRPRTFVPPFYEVKLVGPQPGQAAIPQAPPAAVQPVPPKREAKPAPKAKKAPPKAPKAAPKKGAMLALAAPKQRPAPEAAKPSEAQEAAKQAKPAASAPAQAAPGAKAEGVAVNTESDFKFGWYIAAVRDKIGRNWMPPPDAKDAKAHVVFSINRSGWVLEVKLDEDHSVGSFEFKQAAIRAIRMSRQFPPLPEDFPGQTLEFSVDLMEE